jgi:hypothetical protein
MPNFNEGMAENVVGGRTEVRESVESRKWNNGELGRTKRSATTSSLPSSSSESRLEVCAESRGKGRVFWEQGFDRTGDQYDSQIASWQRWLAGRGC